MGMKVAVLGELGKGEVFSVERKPKPKDPFRLYWRIGKMSKTDSNTSGEFLENLSKVGGWFFWRSNRIRNEETNIVKFIAKDSAEKKQVLRAYKELHALNLIIRISRGTYLCNPEMFIPRPGFFAPVSKAWQIVKYKEENK